MSKSALAAKLENLTPQARIFTDEPMSGHTSFKVGGPADILVVPKSRGDVVKIISFVRSAGMPLTVLGKCSNVLVLDKGIRGIALKLGGGLDEVSLVNGHLTCEAGAPLAAAANLALSEGLRGMEFAAGIPGSVGGGVYMNAGAYDGELKDIIATVESVDLNGAIHVRKNEELALAYRQSIFNGNGEIILSAVFALEAGDKEKIKEKMDDFASRRKSKQPLEWPSAGSTFKRPTGHFAGKLIQDAGLCGLSVGGAQVSEKHAGFIVNKGGAAAADILELIKVVQEKVEKVFGVHLEPEVKIIGE